MTAMSKPFKYGLLYEGGWLNLHDFYIDYFYGYKRFPNFKPHLVKYLYDQGWKNAVNATEPSKVTEYTITIYR